MYNLKIQANLVDNHSFSYNTSTQILGFIDEEEFNYLLRFAYIRKKLTNKTLNKEALNKVNLVDNPRLLFYNVITKKLLITDKLTNVVVHYTGSDYYIKYKDIKNYEYILE